MAVSYFDIESAYPPFDIVVLTTLYRLSSGSVRPLPFEPRGTRMMCAGDIFDPGHGYTALVKTGARPCTIWVNGTDRVSETSPAFDSVDQIHYIYTASEAGCVDYGAVPKGLIHKH